MQVTDGAFEPNDEVDQVRWASVDEAADLLSYPHDAELLRGLHPEP
jgi:8-oxo-dGTP diphosphatase